MFTERRKSGSSLSSHDTHDYDYPFIMVSLLNHILLTNNYKLSTAFGSTQSPWSLMSWMRASSASSEGIFFETTSWPL